MKKLLTLLTVGLLAGCGTPGAGPVRIPDSSLRVDRIVVFYSGSNQVRSFVPNARRLSAGEPLLERVAAFDLARSGRFCAAQRHETTFASPMTPRAFLLYGRLADDELQSAGRVAAGVVPSTLQLHPKRAAALIHYGPHISVADFEEGTTSPVGLPPLPGPNMRRTVHAPIWDDSGNNIACYTRTWPVGVPLAEAEEPWQLVISSPPDALGQPADVASFAHPQVAPDWNVQSALPPQFGPESRLVLVDAPVELKRLNKAPWVSKLQDLPEVVRGFEASADLEKWPGKRPVWPMWGVKPLSVFRAPWAAERILAVLPEQNGRVRIEQWTPPQTEEAADEPRRLARIDRFLWARPMHRTVLVAQLVPPDKHYSGRRTRLLLLGGDGDTTPLGILPGRPRRDDVFLLVNER